jgi:hypothetical protein
MLFFEKKTSATSDIRCTSHQHTQRHQRHLFNVTATHATRLHFKWLTRSDVWPVLSTVDTTFQSAKRAIVTSDPQLTFYAGEFLLQQMDVRKPQYY